MSKAIAVSNYLIEKSIEKNNKPLKLRGLITYVYLVHGFSLALFNKSALDYPVDKVENLGFEPNIPSVYHTFSRYGNKEIKEKGGDGYISENEFITSSPLLTDQELIKVCDMVLNRYSCFTEKQLIEIISKYHKILEFDRKNIIDDKSIKMFFTNLIDVIIETQ